MGLVPGPNIRVLDATGMRRIATASEIAAVRLAVHVALWLRGRASGFGVDSLLVWELYESTSGGFLRGALELLNDPEHFPVPILLVAPPSAVEQVPEAVGSVLEVTLNDQGRPVFRQRRTARPIIQLSSLPVSSVDVS
jgi:hypothetical protein